MFCTLNVILHLLCHSFLHYYKTLVHFFFLRAHNVQVGVEHFKGFDFLPDDRISREDDPFSMKVLGIANGKLFMQVSGNRIFQLSNF
jgi:hypothetical protein